jgi:iron complex transport system substrate-binding protein
LFIKFFSFFGITKICRKSKQKKSLLNGYFKINIDYLCRPDMKQHICFILIFASLLFSCQKKGSGSVDQNLNENIPVSLADSVCFAKGFQIEFFQNYTLATVHNPWNVDLVLQRYVLVPKAATLPETLPEGILIRTPLERTVCFGSVQCSFFSEFGALSTLVGVCEPQYIHIPYIEEGVRNGTIADLGQASNPQVEKILLIEPEALFIIPFEGVSHGQFTQLGIPVIECGDYMEPSPLARAEWIRFLALFFDKKEMADSLFAKIVSDYNQLKTLSAQADYKPSVFTETSYNGVWYEPGGNSYVANLLRDAGADYIWKEDTNTGSIALSFESVLDKAEKADFWLIKHSSPHELTYNELKQNNQNYALFDAYEHRNIYTCNTEKVPYYEDLSIHPDYVLKDMVWIFHPELLPDYQPHYYYKAAE